jgi:hypothetical protein
MGDCASPNENKLLGGVRRDTRGAASSALLTAANDTATKRL